MTLWLQIKLSHGHTIKALPLTQGHISLVHSYYVRPCTFALPPAPSRLKVHTSNSRLLWCRRRTFSSISAGRTLTAATGAAPTCSAQRSSTARWPSAASGRSPSTSTSSGGTGSSSPGPMRPTSAPGTAPWVSARENVSHRWQSKNLWVLKITWLKNCAAIMCLGLYQWGFPTFLVFSGWAGTCVEPSSLTLPHTRELYLYTVKPY